MSGGAVTARGQHRPWEGIGLGLFSAPLEVPGCRMRDAADLSLCMMGKSQPRAAPLRPHRHSHAHRPLLLLAQAACSPAWQLGRWGFGWGPPALPGCRGAGSIPWGLEGREESRCLGEVAMGRGWPVLHRGGGAWGRGAGVTGWGRQQGHLPSQRHPETGSCPHPEADRLHTLARTAPPMSPPASLRLQHGDRLPHLPVLPLHPASAPPHPTQTPDPHPTLPGCRRRPLLTPTLLEAAGCPLPASAPVGCLLGWLSEDPALWGRKSRWPWSRASHCLGDSLGLSLGKPGRREQGSLWWW